MDFYNNDPQADAIGRTQVSLEQIRAIMISNMEQARLPPPPLLNGISMDAHSVLLCRVW